MAVSNFDGLGYCVDTSDDDENDGGGWRLLMAALDKK